MLKVQERTFCMIYLLFRGNELEIMSPQKAVDKSGNDIRDNGASNISAVCFCCCLRL